MPLTPFFVATLALNLAPGPDMTYVAARSLGQGRRAGLISALGISAGCLVHIVAASAGVAVLLRESVGWHRRRADMPHEMAGPHQRGSEVRGV